jgi:hypothetical protein
MEYSLYHEESRAIEPGQRTEITKARTYRDQAIEFVIRAWKNVDTKLHMVFRDPFEA